MQNVEIQIRNPTINSINKNEFLHELVWKLNTFKGKLN